MWLVRERLKGQKKNYRDCEEATDPLSEATLDAGLHLPLVQMMDIFQYCFPVDEHKQVASPRHCTCERYLMCLSLSCCSHQVPKLDTWNRAAQRPFPSHI